MPRRSVSHRPSRVSTMAITTTSAKSRAMALPSAVDIANFAGATCQVYGTLGLAGLAGVLSLGALLLSTPRLMHKVLNRRGPKPSDPCPPDPQPPAATISAVSQLVRGATSCTVRFRQQTTNGFEATTTLFIDFSRNKLPHGRRAKCARRRKRKRASAAKEEPSRQIRSLTNTSDGPRAPPAQGHAA